MLPSLQLPVLSPIAAEVVEGLTASPKHISPKFFYDARGSELFEQITRLPEYYLTRTERSILEAHHAEILRAAGSGLSVIELGAGTAEKTHILLKTLLQDQLHADYYPVDVSYEALKVAKEGLAAFAPRLRVKPIIADYTHGLPALNRISGRKLVLYIGSSIGNFEPESAAKLLRNIAASLAPDDALLLGTDMVKDEAVLSAAYNDSQGTTAEFNLNMLRHLNCEVGSDFDLRAFQHIAFFNAKESRIEMHLESRRKQQVHIPGAASISFSARERIHTENSYKFTMPMVERILNAGGLTREQTWSDPRGWFTLHLVRLN